MENIVSKGAKGKRKISPYLMSQMIDGRNNVEFDDVRLLELESLIQINI